MNSTVLDLSPTPASGCCGCKLRDGLNRLHMVASGAHVSFELIKNFCIDCGRIPELGRSLSTIDLKASAELYSLIDNAHAAVADRKVTTGLDERMPDPFNFSELGVIRTIDDTAVFDNYPRNRHELEPLLRGHLGLSDINKTRILPAANFSDITASIDVTVGHVFEPDAESSRPDRIDDSHILLWPLIPATLLYPFEIWEQQTPGKSNEKGWAFLACYWRKGHILYHLVWVNRKRLIRSSYQLTGRGQAQSKRRGVPLYTAY